MDLRLLTAASVNSLTRLELPAPRVALDGGPLTLVAVLIRTNVGG